MNLFFRRSVVIGIMLFVVFGCSETFNDLELTSGGTTFKSVSVDEEGTSGNSVNLIEGQHIDAGDILFDNIDTNNDGESDALEVSFQTQDGLELVEVHFWIGNVLIDMPQTKKDNPKVGNFPYTFTQLAGSKENTFRISFKDLGYSGKGTEDYLIAAHTSV